MNPDLKVYLTTIAVNSTNDWLKPGMTAKAEIFIEQLTNVVYVPLQCVVIEEGKYVCYLPGRSSKSDRREVEVGSFNEEFIEVKKGLAEGEKVLLRPRKDLTPAAADDEKTSAASESPNAAIPKP